ncbi:MAG: phage antirepressor KilAC domain-containing protein [Hafnia sp.]
MNNLIAMSSEMTMGTREIAEMLGAKHGNIKVSAERLYDAGALTAALKQSEFDHNGNTYFEYLLNKIDSITLVAQNCPRFTAELVKRWDELERGVAKPSFMDSLSPAAVIMLEDLDSQLKESKRQLAIAAPKAEVFDKVMERDNLINATQVAQQVGMSAIKMNRKLDEIGGVYNKCVKRGRAFCHSWILDGYGEMKIGEIGYPQALFTPKGSLRVVELFTSEGII